MEIEQRWQRRWLESGAFRAEPRKDRPKFYCFEYPPYPNSKLHIGHVRNYSIGDVTARYRRMRGYNVLYTQGFDAFGLPNDLAARKQGCHPAEWSERCIEVICTQFDRLGLSYDRERLVSYHQEDYYRWTQWLFLKFLDAGLAYRGGAMVNWCDQCKTTLADDQLDAGRCWRCDQPTRLRRMTQWFLRTTAFSEAMLANLDEMDGWSDQVRKIQRNWIGLSRGMDARFEVEGTPGLSVTVFTINPQILYGMTYIAVSLNHPLVESFEHLGLLDREQLEALEALRIESQANRGSFTRGKKGRPPAEGLHTGIKLRRPLTGELVPLVIANMVDEDFAHGALGGVPAHDPGDRELAINLGLPLSGKVLIPPQDHPAGANPMAFEDSWVLINSGPFDGLTIAEAKEQIPRALAEAGCGGPATHYRLRDWLISRQRYWGTPIPVLDCRVCGMVPVPIEDLPVKLPKDVDLSAVGNPLEYHVGFVSTPCPRCGRVAQRETDTMDVFMSALWFCYRYAIGSKPVHPFTSDEANYWMPGDIAIGGVEHATTAYFHDRFLSHALHHMGMIDYDEFSNGLLAHQLVMKGGRKMSKSLGNTIDPDEIIETYGADSLRLAILFIAPPDKKLEWSEPSIRGCHTFLAELHNLVQEFATQVSEPISKAADQGKSDRAQAKRLAEKSRELLFDVHQVVEDVTNAYEQYQINVVCQRLMKLKRKVEELHQEADADIRHEALISEALGCLVRMLAPITPHICEELWTLLGGKGLVMHASWPRSDRSFLASRDRKVVVQLDGAHWGEIEVPSDASSGLVRDIGLRHLIPRTEEKGVDFDPSRIQDWLYLQKRRFDILNFITKKRTGKH